MVEQGTNTLIRACKIYMIAIVAVDGKKWQKEWERKKEGKTQRNGLRYFEIEVKRWERSENKTNAVVKREKEWPNMRMGKNERNREKQIDGKEGEGINHIGK